MNIHDTTGPVVIGGIGGSGTRIVAEVLQRLGFYIGADLNKPYDNLWFVLLITGRELYNEKSTDEISKRLSILEKAMTGKLHPRLNEFVLMLEDTLDRFRQWQIPVDQGPGWFTMRRILTNVWPIWQAVKMVWLSKRLLTLLRSSKVDRSAYSGWGWKAPTSYIYIEQLSKYFDNLIYIHVIRHGLDMAYSENQANSKKWGEIFGLRIPDESELLAKTSLNYWIRANTATIERGERLLNNRFFVLNYDDLCFNPQAEINRLIKFLGLDVQEAQLRQLCSLVNSPLRVCLD